MWPYWNSYICNKSLVYNFFYVLKLFLQIRFFSCKNFNLYILLSIKYLLIVYYINFIIFVVYSTYLDFVFEWTKNFLKFVHFLFLPNFFFVIFYCYVSVVVIVVFVVVIFTSIKNTFNTFSNAFSFFHLKFIHDFLFLTNKTHQRDPLYIKNETDGGLSWLDFSSKT